METIRNKEEEEGKGVGGGASGGGGGGVKRVIYASSTFSVCLAACSDSLKGA